MSKIRIHIKEKKDVIKELPDFIDRIWLEKYKPSAHNKMKEQLRRINRDVFGTPIFNIENYLEHYPDIIQFIEKQKPSVGKVLCNTVRQALECLEDKNTPSHKAFYELFGRLIKTRKNDLFVIVDKETFPSFRWNDVREKWIELNNVFSSRNDVRITDYQAFLLLSLHYLLPPLRPQDWINSKIVFLDNDTDIRKYAERNGNFIDMTNKILVVADYKTVMTHGIRIIPFGELSAQFGGILNDIIIRWLELNGGKPYLFTTREDHPIAEQNITKIFDKILIKGNKTNATELRNLFISEKIVDANISLEHRERLAYIMGHTIQTQTFIYSKYSSCLHGEK